MLASNDQLYKAQHLSDLQRMKFLQFTDIDLVDYVSIVLN